MPTASRVGYADAAGSIVEENTSEQSDSEDERNRNLDNGTELDLDGNDQDSAMTNEADDQPQMIQVVKSLFLKRIL